MIVPGSFMEMDCLASPDDVYRLWLSRSVEWPVASTRPLILHEWVIFLMLNPSKARGEGVGDPTQRKCNGFAARFGARRYGLVNLFSRSTPYPNELFQDGYAAAIGPDNDTVLSEVFREARRERYPVICAWGKPSKFTRDEMRLFEERVGEVCQLMPPSLKTYCIGMTADGHPRHPLMPAYTDQLRHWANL